MTNTTNFTKYLSQLETELIRLMEEAKADKLTLGIKQSDRAHKQKQLPHDIEDLQKTMLELRGWMRTLELQTDAILYKVNFIKYGIEEDLEEDSEEEE